MGNGVGATNTRLVGCGLRSGPLAPSPAAAAALASAVASTTIIQNPEVEHVVDRTAAHDLGALRQPRRCPTCRG